MSEHKAECVEYGRQWDDQKEAAPCICRREHPDYEVREYEVVVYKLDPPKSGGPWLIRVYTHDGEHVHSAEGGVSLSTGLHEVERAITRHQEAANA